MAAGPSHKFRERPVASAKSAHKSNADAKRSDGISTTNARNGSGKGLHHHATDPSQHDHDGPKDVWIFTKYDHADRCKSRQCSEKRADRTKKFCNIDLPAATAS